MEIDLELEESNEFQTKYNTLQELIPDADPKFIHEKSMEFVFKTSEFQTFVSTILEGNNYPKKSSDLKEENSEVNIADVEDMIKLETGFQSIEKFVEKYPEPLKYFQSNSDHSCVQESLMYLKHKFRFVSITIIRDRYKENNRNLTLTFHVLKNLPKSRNTKRSNNEIKKMNFLQEKFVDEVYFLENEDKILQFIKDKKLARSHALAEARLRNELVECLCCYDTELLIEDMLACSEGHLFCKPCVLRSSEILLGERKTDFPCLTDCKGEFHIDSLKIVLPVAAYDKLLRTKQEKEVLEAGIVGLVSCPFCEYAEILPEEDNIFSCKSCRKESCKLCRKLSHIPLRCKEAEERDARKYIEDKMTDELIRICYVCKAKFIKQDGCNKMTCSCGAKMCYVCRKPVKDYDHFSNPPDNIKCPLYSNNDELHIIAVRNAGELAKREILQMNPTIKMKFDPLKDLGVHPAKKAKS